MIEYDFDIKKKVEEVLEETGFAEQRVAKMDVDDLLKYVLCRFVLECHSTKIIQVTLSVPRRRHPLRVRVAI